MLELLSKRNGTALQRHRHSQLRTSNMNPDVAYDTMPVCVYTYIYICVCLRLRIRVSHSVRAEISVAVPVWWIFKFLGTALTL